MSDIQNNNKYSVISDHKGGFMPRKAKDKDYISNKDMYQELMKCQKEGEISPRLGMMFDMLTRKYATKAKFSGYSYIDLMISAGKVACCAAFMKFNSEKTNNPFAYFTQCIHHAFLQVLKDEKKHQTIRDELLIENGLNPSDTYIQKYYDELEEKKITTQSQKEQQQQDRKS